MKNLKRVLLLVALLLGMAVSSAQAENNYRDPRFQLGLRAGFGVNESGNQFTDPIFTPNLDFSLNWKLGAIPLYIETGLWIDLTEDFEDYDEDHNIVAQFKIPAILSWHFGIGKNISVGPMTGPYFCFATDYYSDNDAYFDLGWRVGAQFNWKKLFVSMGGDFGMISRSYDGYNCGTTVGFFVNVGCNFISR